MQPFSSMKASCCTSHSSEDEEESEEKEAHKPIPKVIATSHNPDLKTEAESQELPNT